MPPRSNIAKLPDELRGELNRRIEQNAFAGYEALSDWLKDQGFEISRSAVQAYGAKFKEKMGALRIATEQARAIADAAGDDANAMGEALVMLAQEKAFQVLLDLEIDADEQNFGQLTRAIADLNRAAVQQKRYAAEVQSRAKVAASEAETALRAEGISDDTVELIKAKFLGIAA
ncbi:phage protein Gp27 family protein [Vacuolonema iberomarrocanum]|uniref:phage protein Gp27 family protein n=1 Tax=Vacuolonema iberomarrocanum TaxID=3454632 RepID=UPI0019E010B6|nr:DUF3486 family protein [filamentous cyanobacterium LEGE 07170]